MELASQSWMKKAARSGALLCVLGGSGCSGWHSVAALPGLDTWKDERAVIKKAQNDPFPSPQQVGLK